MEDLQIIIDELIKKHGKDKVQEAVAASTSTDPVQPPTGPKP